MTGFPIVFNEFAPIVIGCDWSQVFGLSNDDGTAVGLSGWTFTHELKDPAGVLIASAGELGSVGTITVSGSTVSATVSGTTYTYYPVTVSYPNSATAGLLPMTAHYAINSAVGGVKTCRFYGSQIILAVA